MTGDGRADPPGEYPEERPTERIIERPIAVWLGSAAPARSVRWIDGALEAAVALGAATAIVAGDQSWHYLAADRARRAGLAAVGVLTELRLDALGWAHVVAAIVRDLRATTVLVDEASRSERASEVGAIAELLDRAHLTSVIAIARGAAAGSLAAQRILGRHVQHVAITGPVVIGVRIAGPQIDEYPTPVPSSSMRKLTIAELGIDAALLARHALPSRAARESRKTVERVAAFLSLHAPARSSGRGG